MLAGNDGQRSAFVAAQDDDIEDVVDGEDVDVNVETEADDDGGDDAQPIPTDMTGDEEEEEEEKPLKPSEFADTHLLFTKPTDMEFPAGHMVRLLVGFSNKGDKDFLVDTMEGSFRYPQDYNFYIQNFTTVRYGMLVEPRRQATFEYLLTPSETFSSRSFGLAINLHYKDSEGNIFQDAVFNETIKVVEPDEGLDGETFFLYVFLAAVAVLLLVGAQQTLSSFGKKRLSKPRAAVEMGTQNKSDVDYDWIPKENIEMSNRSPGRSPKQSPRQRRAKRAHASGDE